MSERIWHFSGVAGAGMNPLARLLAARGETVQGSDRSLDAGHNQAIAALLREAGVRLLPQDGSAIHPGLHRVIASAAVEATTVELQRARELGIPITARPGLLAELLAAAQPGIAVAGTSGKSTVVGMTAHLLTRCGHPLTVLGGAALAVEGASHMGLCTVGPAQGPVLAEACESDGTLVGYHPGIALIHTISRDHDELDGLRKQFATFAAQGQRLLVNAGCAEALALARKHPRALRYGLSPQADLRLEPIRLGPWRSTGELHLPDGLGALLDLPQPGLHTLENACAAVAIATSLGVPLAQAAAALEDFPGVARRFQVLGKTEGGMTVVDDYAHNGEKIRAAILAAQHGCERLVAIFQPHGFGPARFLRNELREMLPQVLREQDRFCYAGIFYAGGSVQRDISSADLAQDLAPLRAKGCDYAESHLDVLSWVSQTAIPGDTVLLMGARDPQLPALAQAIFETI